jgi:non-ribosomal peptide synthetase component E (peptide arylation enzyme)
MVTPVVPYALMAREIPADAKARLADYKVPEWLQIVNEIPRNALGKIDRTSLLAMTSDPRICRDG